MNFERMKNNFFRLLETESPYGFEKAAADIVCSFLDQNGIAWTEDGGITGTNTGNIIIAGEGDARIAFYSHLDTIRIFEKKKIRCEGSVVKAEGGGVLGIDDMSGVALAMELAASLHEKGGIAPDIHIVFTVSEEQGFRGAWAMDPRHFRNALNFVIDSGGVPVVRVVRRGVGQKTFSIAVQGTMGHASLWKGKNAALLSAKLVTLLEPGSKGKESFLHIGSIECPGNPNTIPDLSLVEGQIIFFDGKEGEAIAGEIKKTAEQFALTEGCQVDLKIINDCESWFVGDDDPIIRYAKEAAVMADLPFALGETRSGSDAQVIHQRGGRVVKLSTGMMSPHSKEECIDLKELNNCAGYLWCLAAAPVH